MPTTPAPATSPKPLDYLSKPITVGDPDISGPLAVFPLFGPEPDLDYVSFAQAREAGAAIKELDGDASVNDLLVNNPTANALLVYEGEEVLGAQQNRNFDVSVLVGVGATLSVPVSCVEAGRWDGSRHGEAFRPSPQTARSELRRAKHLQAHTNAAAGRERRAEQSAVWGQIAEDADRFDVEAPTGASHDIFESHREHLNKLLESISVHDGQSGALVAINGRFVVLDWVSRTGVYASLHAPLAQGYALDALDAQGQVGPPQPDADQARAVVKSILEADGHEHDGIGEGRELRTENDSYVANGLVSGDELVVLTAFPADGAPDERGARQAAARTRINRPSRRRR